LTSKRAFALAALLGFAAILLGGLLLLQGRKEDELPGVTYKPVYVDAGPMLHLVDVLASDALEGRAAGTPGNEAARGFMEVHGLVVNGLYVLIALHVLGALKHQFVDRDNVLHRMIPLIPRRP
jgi:cytochrome b561